MYGSSPTRARQWPRWSARLIAAQRAGQAAAGVPLGCLARLQRAFDPERNPPDPGQGTAAVAGIVEPLTAREREVLGMLAAGRSNQAIASELVVTLDTVKKHVSHVLGKLGAANRTEAVTRARELRAYPLAAARYGQVPRSSGRVCHASPAPSCCSLAPRIPPAMSTFG